jgi:hypothetical protein
MSKILRKSTLSDADYARILAGLFRAAKNKQPEETVPVLGGILHALVQAPTRKRGCLVDLIAGNLNPEDAQLFAELVELTRIDELDFGAPLSVD